MEFSGLEPGASVLHILRQAGIGVTKDYTTNLHLNLLPPPPLIRFDPNQINYVLP